MPIPYYLANPSAFGGLEEDDPDKRQEGPFDAPPPSVDQTKQTRQPAVDPFADDPNDPRAQRLKSLDDQIAGRPRSLGGIIAGFSPHGDKTMANLMLQRKMYGDEAHGDQQLRRQLASSQMMQESAFRRADAQQAAADARAKALVGAAGIRGDAQVTTGAGHDAARVDAAKIGAGARTGAAQIAADSRDYATDNRQPSAGPRASRAPANPQIPVLQAELKQLSKAINDPNITDDQKLPLMRKYNLRRQQLDQMTGQPASAPSAAPSTAPAVKDTKATVRPSATGPNGEKIEWDGTAWVPAS